MPSGFLMIEKGSALQHSPLSSHYVITQQSGYNNKSHKFRLNSKLNLGSRVKLIHITQEFTS